MTAYEIWRYFAATVIIIWFLTIWLSNDRISTAIEGFFTSAIIVGVGAIFAAMSCSTKEFKGYKPTQTYSLYSLENSNGINGQIGGTSWGFNGQINSSKICSFVLDDGKGNITLKSVDVDKVLFHLAEGDTLPVQKYQYHFNYPHDKDAKTIWVDNDEDTFRWHIWIPNNKINQYIRFN